MSGAGRSPVLTSNPLPELISGANCISRDRHPTPAASSRAAVVSAALLIQEAVAAPQRYTPDDAFCIAYSAAQWAVGREF